MQGAAQMAKAPPSRKPEPRRRASWTSPAPSEPLRPGQQPHEREAEHDQDEAGDLLHQELVLREREPDRGGTGAEKDEDGHEPADERQARADDAARRARLAQPLGLDGRDRGEVARDERAARTGRGTRRNRRRTRRRPTFRSRPTLMARSGRARRRAAARARDRAARATSAGSLAAAGVAPAPGEHADDDHAEREPGERQQPRDQLEALPRRLGEHGRAELVDERGLDLALRVARGDPARG